MVFHDHIQVISSRTNTTELEFSTKEEIGGHAKDVSISVRKTEEDASNFFPYTIESIPVHREHPDFPRGPDFQVAVAVSIFRVLNV